MQTLLNLKLPSTPTFLKLYDFCRKLFKTGSQFVPVSKLQMQLQPVHQTSGQLYYSFTVANESINEPQLSIRAETKFWPYRKLLWRQKQQDHSIQVYIRAVSSQFFFCSAITSILILFIIMCSCIFESFLASLGQNEVCMWLCPNCPKTSSNQLKQKYF